MTEILLSLLTLIGAGLIYMLIDCAKSLRESRDINQRMSEMLETELRRQSLLLETAVSAKRLDGRAALRMEKARFGTIPYRLRFHANIRPHSIAGFGIWVFRDGSWHLEEDRCQPGFKPGPPPEIAGRFPGDRIRKEGIANQ